MLNQIKSKVNSILTNEKVKNGLVIVAVVTAAVAMGVLAIKSAEYESDRILDRLINNHNLK
jgi:thiamine phosphate synthase YjbQ (UPF0047 family)